MAMQKQAAGSLVVDNNGHAFGSS